MSSCDLLESELLKVMVQLRAIYVTQWTSGISERLRRVVTITLAFSVALSCVFFILGGTATSASAASFSSASASAVVASPTLLQPTVKYTTDRTPMVTGVTAPNTQVRIFIDGVAAGLATIRKGATVEDAWSFSFVPATDLLFGERVITAQAEVMQGAKVVRKSSISKGKTVIIEQKMGVPVIVGLQVVNEFEREQPTVLGLAPSGRSVEIFVDGKSMMRVQASNDSSGTGHFSATIPVKLPHGAHTVSAVTHLERTDGSLRTSDLSAEFSFRILARSIPDIRNSAPSEVSADTVAPLPPTSPALVETPQDMPEENRDKGVQETPRQEESKEEESIPAPIEAPAEPQPTPTPTPESVTPAPAPEQQPEIENPLPAPSTDTINVPESELSQAAILTLQIIGWSALIGAAALCTYQFRRHRQDIDRMLEETGTTRQEAIDASEKKPITTAEATVIDSNPAEKPLDEKRDIG